MAFAAVSSVARFLDQTLQHQGFILENREQVEHLFTEVSSLQAILENSPQKISDTVTSIVKAVYRARDLIETHIKAHIFQKNRLTLMPSLELLHQAEREIDFIEQKLMEIDAGAVEDLQPIIPKIAQWGLHRRADTIRMLRNSGKFVFRRSYPLCIVGMSGMGKTTLAKLVFNHPDVERVYSIRAWVTASGPYNIRQVMINILDSMGIDMPESEYTSEQLREHLYHSLKDEAYFIVLDDLCDAQVLDDLFQILQHADHIFFRIIVTTRLENVSVSRYVEYKRMTIIDQISCIRESREKAESLLTKVSLLHDILKNSSHEGESLENQISDVGKRVKDFIESCSIEYNFIFSTECLTEVKGEIDLMKQLILKIEEEAEAHHVHSSPTAPLGNIIAEDFMEIKSKLSEQSSKLEIVSLVGMGGIGKTTLAKQVYKDAFFVESFPIRAWVTVSQYYNMKQVLCGLLNSMEKIADSSASEDVLSQRLYQSLKGWKYLIVIDDVWETDVLDDFKRIFPDDKLSSRILLTTRLDTIADYAKSYLHRVHPLNEDESWNLFCKKVFGVDICPPQLEKIGKNIVQNCRGLPLAIIVIGGLLSRGTRNPDYWTSIVENSTSLILSNEDDHCLKILSLSYTHLPDHIKKCFLYTGMFLEDSDIPVSKLVKLWVAEGFLETVESNKLMEDIAYESLLDLVGRSLLLVGKQSSRGKTKTCKLHDVVREFCMREAKLKMFLHITDLSLYGIPARASVPIRLSIHPNKRHDVFPCDDKKLSSLEVSTLHIADWDFEGSLHHLNPKPLRVLFDMERGSGTIAEGALNELLSYNLQYLCCEAHEICTISIPSTFPFLQTLILGLYRVREFKIWNMLQLRHFQAHEIYLPDPPKHENSGNVLEKLQTLSHVYDFRWSKEVVRIFPNLKRLGICYTYFKLHEIESQETELLEIKLRDYGLENLFYLHKLESLDCSLENIPCPSLLHILTFPPSLKKLSLDGCHLPWKEMVTVASLLPNLEVLVLGHTSFEGQEWESSTEENFPKLKTLLLATRDLGLWRADILNFPSLQSLIIKHCWHLKEIPRCIGEIPTLQLIELLDCTKPLADLVKEIKEEQLEYGNDDLEVRIRYCDNEWNSSLLDYAIELDNNNRLTAGVSVWEMMK